MTGGSAADLPYLEGYATEIQEKVRTMISQDRLGDYLRARYPESHEVRNDRALFELANAMKNRFMRNAAPLNKVRYDSKLLVLGHALGTHTKVSRVQGSRLGVRREIRVATVFREAPAAFLKMILVHELAHLQEHEHTKAFYQLCTHMEPDYFQLEFDLRLYLTMLECARQRSQEASPPDGLDPPPGSGSERPSPRKRPG